ncbi:uncharacterized protein PWA37_000273, partial [Arxiozyma heterogenica]
GILSTYLCALLKEGLCIRLLSHLLLRNALNRLTRSPCRLK